MMKRPPNTLMNTYGDDGGVNPTGPLNTFPDVFGVSPAGFSQESSASREMGTLSQQFGDTVIIRGNYYSVRDICEVELSLISTTLIIHIEIRIRRYIHGLHIGIWLGTIKQCLFSVGSKITYFV